MDGTSVEIVRTGLDGHEAEIEGLLRAYYEETDPQAVAWSDGELDGLDIDGAVSADLDRLGSAALEEPLFLAQADGESVGTVQLKQLSTEVAEVKRLYVRPPHRGAGIGRRLMTAAIDGAAADGFGTLRLGVGPFLERAHALYRRLGFESSPPYEGTQAPEVVHDEWCFMERSLDDR